MPSRDVGRVGDHHVDRPVQAGPLASVAGSVASARCSAHARAREVAPRPRRAPAGPPRRRARTAPGTSCATDGRDRPGPGAQVDDHRHAARCGRRRPPRSPPGDLLGLRTRDEHPGPDRERQLAEPGRPGQVLQRDAPGALVDQPSNPSGAAGVRAGPRACELAAAGARARARRSSWRRPRAEAPASARRLAAATSASAASSSGRSPRVGRREPGGVVGLDRRLRPPGRGHRPARRRGCTPCSRCGGRLIRFSG